MCGRFTLATQLKLLEERFSFQADDLSLEPGYNIAPTQQVLTVTGNDANHAQHMRWGLIPSWAKDMSIGSRMINARAETLVEKPSFRTAFRIRRCLILADSFYEWRKHGSARQPMRIILENGEPFAFAGLWESWKDPAGGSVLSCTIVTTSPNSLTEPIHNRMPVILSREAEPAWLDQDIQDTTLLSKLLVPYSGDEMRAYQVSTLVNSSGNNSPELIARTG